MSAHGGKGPFAPSKEEGMRMQQFLRGFGNDIEGQRDINAERRAMALGVEWSGMR